MFNTTIFRIFWQRSLWSAIAVKNYIWGSKCFSIKRIYRPSRFQGYNRLACRPTGSAVTAGRKTALFWPILTQVTLISHSRKKLHIKGPDVFQPEKSTGQAAFRDIIGWPVGPPDRPWRPAEKWSKTSKIVHFQNFWRRLAAKRLALQPTAAHPLNRLGMGYKLLL